jgi:DNA-directed RNA polymerase subunit F
LIEQIQYEHRLALDHVRHLTRVTSAQAEGIMQAVGGLEHVDGFYAAKIADILPTHPNDVRAIFARERFSLGQEEISAIIAAVQENTEA